MVEPSGFQVRGSAPDHYAQFNAPIMAPFVEAVIQRAGVSPGDSVLDVACGTGLVTRRAAEVAGATGLVAGLDVNPGMLAKARSTPMTSGAPITWHEASALELPFARAEFRRVTCQQGIQFFPNLSKATVEMARVLEPGGGAAVSFWAPLVDQTYMAVQIAGLLDVLGALARPLAAAFELAPTLVAEAFQDAGLQDVSADKVTAEVILPDLSEFAPQQLMSLPIAGPFAALPPEQRQRYLARLSAELAPNRNADGTYTCAFSSWVVAGRAAE